MDKLGQDVCALKKGGGAATLLQTMSSYKSQVNSRIYFSKEQCSDNTVEENLASNISNYHLLWCIPNK